MFEELRNKPVIVKIDDKDKVKSFFGILLDFSESTIKIQYYKNEKVKFLERKYVISIEEDKERNLSFLTDISKSKELTRS